ncbi:MAG: hypothetical protein EPO08_03705 [Rhodospirillaceae bacterium]|nr:MAG: hypothetical protein EPO08_03705 [Rhodospirillaceae bacterium]
MAESAQQGLRALQIGMNTSDMPGTLRLYSAAFGFVNAGAQAIWGSTMSAQGLPSDGRGIVWWMLGAQKLFQLEFFHHTRPSQRPMRADWRPVDHGWNRFGIAIADFESCLAVLAKSGVSPITSPTVENGLRRVAFRDPFVGAIVEVIEKPRGDAGCAEGPEIVYATSSVSNLETARDFYANVLGLEILPGELLHKPEHEALWGLPGARRDAFLVRAGDIFLEIVCYRDPVGRPRPADYRTSDQGIVNVALGSRQKETVAAALENLRVAGHVPPLIFGRKGVIGGYIIDPERELEFAAFPPELDAHIGFIAASPFFG